MGLARPGERPAFARLTGGVSSDIWRVELERGPVCVKRSLAKLRVAADWHAPVERGNYERRWLETVAAIAPGAVPTVLGHDDDACLFVMAYLDPDRYPVWKHLLRDGIAEGATAARVGRLLARIHAATAHRPRHRRRLRHELHLPSHPGSSPISRPPDARTPTGRQPSPP